MSLFLQIKDTDNFVARGEGQMLSCGISRFSLYI
jgi:hypothetical protein